MSKETSDVKKIQIDYRDFYPLVGRLLTLVDATYTDKEQRKAQKDVVKPILYNWIHDLYEQQYPGYDFAPHGDYDPRSI